MITSFAYARGDQIVIQYLLNSAALGFYGGAYRYLETLSLLPAALSQNLFPLAAQKEGIRRHQLIKIVAVVAVIGGIISALLFFLSNFFIVSLMGQNYEPAVGVLQILSLVLFLFFLNAPLASVVQSSSFVQKFLPFGILNTIANVLLNIAAIPIYGIYGAAWVMVVTEISGLAINLGFVYKIYAQPRQS